VLGQSNKPQAASFKRQASGLTSCKGYCRMHLERIHMKLNKLIKKINKENAPPDGWKASDAFNKAINWDKLNDPKVLKELEELFKDEEKEDEEKD